MIFAKFIIHVLVHQIKMRLSGVSWWVAMVTGKLQK